MGEIVGRECRLAVIPSILEGDAPFGAVITDMNGAVLASSHNTSVTDGYSFAHAELNALRTFEQSYGKGQLDECCLAANAVSCALCYTASLKAGVRRFMFGATCARQSVPFLSLAAMRDMLIESPRGRDGFLIANILGAACKRQIERGLLAQHDNGYRQALAYEVATIDRTDADVEFTTVMSPRITPGTEGLWRPGFQAWPPEDAADEYALTHAASWYGTPAELSRNLISTDGVLGVY